MPPIKFLAMGIIIFILFVEGATGGMFLNTILPGWQGMTGHVLCVAGGYIVQPVWDFGFAKIPIPVGDDLAAGLIIASAISWLFIKRMDWTFKRKVIAFAIAYGLGMAAYKALGLFILYLAEVQYGMTNCIGQFQLGPVIVEWAWFSPLFLIMIVAGIISASMAIMAYTKKGG
jgi:hypothetical protein